ncbi:hypothetical protein TELCIR_13220 [Teladorsagia circumcincta]|uniref:GH18 domain-containing protein n=1 Tax=Teladorsagia circumcincta TaxID=45464 RepID=A0A2G9U4L8_TELCI|nr:hypothetical protein TELCIR_13220 [Teladorsagia circumcincta]
MRVRTLPMMAAEQEGQAQADFPNVRCVHCAQKRQKRRNAHLRSKLCATIDFQNRTKKTYRSRAKRLVISLRCSMQKEEFAKLMQSAARRLKLAASIRSFVDRLSYNGVELRCADLLSKSTKIQFAHFLRVLNKEMKTKSSDICGNTVSIRLSAWQSDLRPIYDVMALNSLHQVVLEPFTVPLLPDTAFVNSPLFPISNQTSITSIDTIIHRWESSGLMRSKILLQIPSYGMEQLLVNRSDVGIGRPTEKEYAVMGQAEVIFF